MGMAKYGLRSIEYSVIESEFSGNTNIIANVTLEVTASEHKLGTNVAIIQGLIDLNRAPSVFIASLGSSIKGENKAELVYIGGKNASSFFGLAASQVALRLHSGGVINDAQYAHVCKEIHFKMG